MLGLIFLKFSMVGLLLIVICCVGMEMIVLLKVELLCQMMCEDCQIIYVKFLDVWDNGKYFMFWIDVCVVVDFGVLCVWVSEICDFMFGLENFNLVFDEFFICVVELGKICVVIEENEQIIIEVLVI